MKKYEIIKNTCEVKYKDRKSIKEGITFEQNESSPEKMESFEDLEAAREALKKYEGYARELSNGSTYYLVTEYYIEENEYDDDGDWITGGNVWDFAKADFHEVEE